MEVALYVLAGRAGVTDAPPATARYPFDPRRRRSSVVDAHGVHVIGAPDAVLPNCDSPPTGSDDAVAQMTSRGLRVLAVAGKPPNHRTDPPEVERGLRLLGLLGLQDPPRLDVAAAIKASRTAEIRIAMVTGDHPLTAAAIAREVGLVRDHGLVLEGKDLPQDQAAPGVLLDRDELVVARVTAEDKLRIAQALQARGARRGDDRRRRQRQTRAASSRLGIAMGASGTDVAREAADLVLLDDHFGTIVAAVELGRSTFANIRRFLTYHLTDNVAELTPFVVWALSGGSIPLAITVLQVLALDIGTDLLPALALGTERPQPRTMLGRRRLGSLIDRAVVTRAFGVLGPAEAVLGNRLLLYAVAIEAITMLVFVGVPPFPGLLGARFQPTRGGCLPALTGPRRARRRHAPEGRPRPPVATGPRGPADPPPPPSTTALHAREHGPPPHPTTPARAQVPTENEAR